MLAFNLGIFFRNLQGQRIRFDAENTREHVQFVGSVAALREHTTLSQELRVVLARGNLKLHISFEEPDEAQEDQPPEVNLRLVIVEASSKASRENSTENNTAPTAPKASKQAGPRDSTISGSTISGKTSSSTISSTAPALGKVGGEVSGEAGLIETELLTTTFAFDEIRLHPEDPPDPEADPVPPAPPQAS